MNGYYLKAEPCEGLPRFYKLYRKLFEHNNEIDPCVSWALMREYPKMAKGETPEQDITVGVEADLMMIYTHEKGEGLGLELLNRLKQGYQAIRTSWSGSTKEGRALCLKADFVREGDILIWRNYAVQKPGAAPENVEHGRPEEDKQAGSGGMGEGDPKQATT